MFKLNKILLLVVLVCFIFNVKTFAQQANKHWKLSVLSLKNKTALSNCTVKINELNYTTDSLGVLSLPELLSKSIHIEVSCIGYMPKQKHLFYKKDGQIDTMLLTPNVFELKEVSVSENFPKRIPLSTSVALKENDLEKLAGESLGQQLAHLQGVNTLQTGATIAKPVINGMHSNRILILNNGVRQEGQQWGAEHAPEIDPFIAKEITVIKGAESVRYGSDAIGGVVLVEPPALPTNDIIHGELDAVGESNGKKQAYSATLQGNIPKIPNLGWRIQGTKTKSGDIKSANYYLNNTGSKELNYSAALGYSHDKLGGSIYFSHFSTELGILKAAHIGSQQDLMTRIKEGKPYYIYPFTYDIEAPRQQIVHNLLKIKSNITLNDQSKITLQYDFQNNHRQEFDLRRGGRTSIPSLDLSLMSQNLNLDWKKNIKETWQSELGIQASNQVNNNTPGTFVTPLIPNFDSYAAGVYAIQKINTANAIYEMGLRYDYKFLDAAGFDTKGKAFSGVFHFHNFSWNLAAEYHITHKLHFNSNLGMAWRPPQVNELYSNGLHHGTASIEIGNRNLKSENAIKWINTLSLHGDKIEFELSLFAQYIKNYIYLNPTLKLDTSLRGTFPVFNYQQNNAFFSGVDAWAKYHFSKKLNYELKISVVNARNLTLKNYFPLIPTNRISQSINYQIPDIGKLKSSYVGIEHQFTAQQNRYTAGSDYAAPPSSYHLININMGTKIPIQHHMLITSLSVNNLFNRAYKDYMNRFRYYADDIGRNIQLRIIYKF